MTPARREEILAGLESMLLTDGFSTLTIDDIATRLHCSKSTLYCIASSKEQVVVAVLRRFFRQTTAAVESEVEAIDDPGRRVATFLASVGARMHRMSTVCYHDVVSHTATDEILRLNAQACARRVRELIGDGIEAGVFRPVHAGFVAEAARLIIEGIVHGRLLDQTGLTAGEASVELSALVLNALVETEATLPPKINHPGTGS